MNDYESRVKNRAIRRRLRFFLNARHLLFASVVLMLACGLTLGLTTTVAYAAKKTVKNSKKNTKTAAMSPGSSKSGSRGGGKGLDFGRSQSTLPTSTALKTPEAKQRDLRAVKPPRSGDFYGEGNTKEIEYEKILDQEIRKYYELTQKYKRSRSRGEFWLRLAERYVEKAELIEFREQAEYDKKLKDFLDKKTTKKPKVNLNAARDYNRKAIQLYEWFIRDFPEDKKVDQALFFLGYNHFEAGDTKQGEAYYQRLVKEHSNSVFVTESHFALGEYYFENDKWQDALDNYRKVIERKKARLNIFAMYKASWCLYRVNRVDSALKMLERVVRMSRSGDGGNDGGRSKAINKIRLAAEALRDYVPFYAESGDFKNAHREFARVSQDESTTFKMLERLAYIYADAGNRTAANYVFKELIAQNPTGEKAADYQYQVILTFATADQRRFREELVIWLEKFGPGSAWQNANKKNAKLIEDTAKLQETTLRNHVLQMHQTAQNSRAQYSQQQANAGYGLYMRYFPNTEQAAEMEFFHGELLFDMGRYSDAAKVYMKSAEQAPKGKYYEKAVANAVLALEKELPSAQEIDEVRGDSIEKVPLPLQVTRFKEACDKYFAAFPKSPKTSDVKRRLGVLLYSYNHFEPAMDLFEQILQEDPKSQNAEIAGNLLLDIYKLRGDMAGLADRGHALLKNPTIAKSKFGEQIRGMLENVSFVKAQKLAEGKDHGKSAKEFESFASNYGRSDLVLAARYNAGVNYEKAGDINSSVRMHMLALSTPAKDEKSKKLHNDSRNALARLYAQTGQLELAAKQYESYANDNPKDQTAINAYFNAAVIWDGLGNHAAAIRNYDAYMAKSRKADRIEVIFYEAEIARRRGSFSKAAQLYDQYLESGPRDPAHAIKARFQHAEMSRRLQRPTKARESYQRTIATYQAYKKKGQEVGAQYAAEARFILAQDVMQELRAVKFTSSDKQQAKAAAQVKALREKYFNEMKDVIRFDYAPMIVAALASSGQMFDYIAYTFSRIPVPAGFSAEDGQKYKELIQQETNAIQTEAKNSYKAARDKAIEFESFDQWSSIASQGLARYDKDMQDAGELPYDAAAVDWMGL